MANPSSSNSSVSTSDSSFKQLSYCQLCKLSHDTAKRHVYSKRHQTSLQSLLRKFAAKVKEIKASVKTPCVRDEYYEIGAKMWCHFCECEVEKHLYEDGVVICYGEALHHFKSVQHLKNAKHFWWKNRVDQSKLDSYLITSSEHSAFRENVSKAKAEYLQQKAGMHQQHVAHIISVEALRKEVVQKAVHEESESCSFKAHDGTGVKSRPISQSTSGGNIFTGMLPPWLQQDDEIADKKEIGPSLADYEKNCKSAHSTKLETNEYICSWKDAVHQVTVNTFIRFLLCRFLQWRLCAKANCPVIEWEQTLIEMPQDRQIGFHRLDGCGTMDEDLHPSKNLRTGGPSDVALKPALVNVPMHPERTRAPLAFHQI